MMPSAPITSEDEGDIAAVVVARAADAAWAARLKAERGRPVETTIPLEVVEAELGGAHPIRAWREYRGWTEAELSAKASVARDVIAQIETRRQSAGISSLNRLACTLGVPIGSLIEDNSEEIAKGEN